MFLSINDLCQQGVLALHFVSYISFYGMLVFKRMRAKPVIRLEPAFVKKSHYSFTFFVIAILKLGDNA